MWSCPTHAQSQCSLRSYQHRVSADSTEKSPVELERNKAPASLHPVAARRGWDQLIAVIPLPGSLGLLRDSSRVLQIFLQWSEAAKGCDPEGQGSMAFQPGILNNMNNTKQPSLCPFVISIQVEQNIYWNTDTC